jgi:hypothetical protein
VAGVAYSLLAAPWWNVAFVVDFRRFWHGGANSEAMNILTV